MWEIDGSDRTNKMCQNSAVDGWGIVLEVSAVIMGNVKELRIRNGRLERS